VQTKQLKYIIPLGMLYVTALLSANLVGIKVLHFGFIALPASILTFPLTFILDDIFTEVYGYAYTRLIIWTALACNVLLVLILQITVWLPAISSWHFQDAYAQIFMLVPRIVLASFISTPVGQFVNAYVLAKLKLRTHGQAMGLRLVASTTVGAFSDSIIFIAIAFIGIVPLKVVFIMIASQTIFKVVYEVILLPVSLWLIAWLKRNEHLNHFDYNTDFNPFKLRTSDKES
jgi:uncharacterized integral membrane protein (TIGR00697 family)